MKPRHPKYTIKPEDTLQSITKLFGVEVDIWKRYHNSMCRLDDIIRDELPKHLGDIYLLPELWEKEISLNHTSINNEEAGHNVTRGGGVQSKKSEQKLLTNWAIYPRWNYLNHAYWFRYILEEGASRTEIRYKIHVCNLAQESEDTTLCLINRVSDVYINDELPNLCMDELAYETGKVFYPMVIEITKKSEWVALRNYEQIQNNWINTVRPYVELRFGGEIGEKYLARIDKAIGRKDEVEEIFRNELFIRFYFNTFYHSYSPEFEINRVVYFPLEGDMSGYFGITCKLDRTLNGKGYKRVTQNGISLIKIGDTPDGYTEDGQINYKAEILLNAHTNHVQEASAEWHYAGGQKKIKLVLFPTRRPCEEKVDVRIDKPNKNKGLFFSLPG